jgi:hypothetical protein
MQLQNERRLGSKCESEVYVLANVILCTHSKGTFHNSEVTKCARKLVYRCISAENLEKIKYYIHSKATVSLVFH